METGDLIWGIVMIAGGVFIGIYGEMLFKFVLAMIGFLVGFSALYLILEGQDETLRCGNALLGAQERLPEEHEAEMREHERARPRVGDAAEYRHMQKREHRHDHHPPVALA